MRVRLLARREHSLAELADKLGQKEDLETDVQNALERCSRDGLQSDARFAESLTRTRVMQGYGPVKIRQELLAKQVSRELIDDALRMEHENWVSHAMRVWEKKYALSVGASFAEKQSKNSFLCGWDFLWIRSLAPAELVIDHSVQVDEYGTAFSLRSALAARIPAQPRALRLLEMGPVRLQQLLRRSSRHGHLSPGQSRSIWPVSSSPPKSMVS